MTVSEDEVIGTFHKQEPSSMLEDMMDGYPITFRDLDKNIQDRLRAAEEMANQMKKAIRLSDDKHYALWGDEPFQKALDAYKATFKETRGKP